MMLLFATLPLLEFFTGLTVLNWRGDSRIVFFPFQVKRLASIISLAWSL